MMLALPPLAAPLSAQQGLEAAKGSTSLLLADNAALTADIAETALTFVAASNGVFGKRLANTRVSVAAQKYKREFFGKGQFTPSLTVERREVFGVREKNGRLLNVFLGGRWELTDNKFADTTNGQTYVLDRTVGNSVAGALGTTFVHSAPSWRDFMVGLQVEGRRGWNSGGIRTPQSVCVDKNRGLDKNGAPVRVTKCEDRFLGRLDRQVTSGQLRLDAVGLRTLVRRGDSTSTSLGWLGAASTDFRRGGKPAHNFSAGPMLFASSNPDVAVAALLLEINDAWNGSGQVPDREDRVAIRFYIGVPFRF